MKNPRLSSQTGKQIDNIEKGSKHEKFVPFLLKYRLRPFDLQLSPFATFFTSQFLHSKQFYVFHFITSEQVASTSIL